MSTPALTKIFLERMQQPGAEARKEGDAAGSAGGRRQEDRGGLRSAVPGARSHGAAQLHRGRAARIAATSGRPRRGRARRARSRRASPACRRKRSRSTRSTWAAASDGALRADYIGEAVEVSKAVGRAGEAHLVARRRLAAGSLPPGVLHAIRRRAGCRWLAARALQPHRVPAVRRRAQRPVAHRRRRRRRYAVRDSAHAGGLSRRGSGNSGELLALGGLLAEYLLRGELPR